MLNRIIDISNEPARLCSSLNRLMILRRDMPEVAIPFNDVAVVVVSHPRVLFTQAVLADLAAAGGVFVSCDRQHLPVSMLLPLDGHSIQAERFAAQAAAAVPKRKRLWQQIVQAKIRSQHELLSLLGREDRALASMVSRVQSGDPQNLEAQAARRYWPGLFGEAFRRQQQTSVSADLGAVSEDGVAENSEMPVSPETVIVLQNRWLNYGYAILRAMTARAICAAGLHPSFGLHHHNRYDAFALADDLMEPFRPVVDRAVIGLFGQSQDLWDLNKGAKGYVLKALTGRWDLNGERRTLFDVLARAAASLTQALTGDSRKLELPERYHAAS